ncbi:MAG: hypothetical protein QM702_20800 [Rubrivivax sp.]
MVRGARSSLAALAIVTLARTSAAEDTTTTTTSTTSSQGTTSTTVTGPTPADPIIPYPPPSPRVVGRPDGSYDRGAPQYYPSFAWIATQLVPSPEVAWGRLKRIEADGTAKEELESAFGLRWQLTPVAWSWGTHRSLNRFRYFVVDPLARNSGSIELNTSFEYLWGHVDRLLVRPGIRGNFPLLHRGEYLSCSLGTSTYVYDRTPRVAYDAGIYILYGVLGAQVTVAPAHDPLNLIATIRIRYF